MSSKTARARLGNLPPGLNSKKNDPKPIFSIEELNQYDKYDQAHKLQITSKLASSRFLVDSQAHNALALQMGSIDLSSSGVFGPVAGSSAISSLDTLGRQLASPKALGPFTSSPRGALANSQLPHKFAEDVDGQSGGRGRRGQAAASVGGGR